MLAWGGVTSVTIFDKNKAAKVIAIHIFIKTV